MSEVAVDLYSHQIDAIRQLKNGSILCGGVGTGKSRTAIAYYAKTCGGYIRNGKIILPDTRQLKNLCIITTAQKRDNHEWVNELEVFDYSRYLDSDDGPTIVIDSWQNICKYTKYKNFLFIFDEHHAVGTGVWADAFVKIAKGNEWILLTATPGDCWSDYFTVFKAKGYFKTKREFEDNHVIYNYGAPFPQISRYVNTGILNRYRRDILVDMEMYRKTKQHHEYIYVDYNKDIYDEVFKKRFNPEKKEPFKSASEFCQYLRKIINTDISRGLMVEELVKKHGRAIIFYNYNYELDILRTLEYGPNVQQAEWNGHKHEPLPGGNEWVYFVQYTAGSEGWNCICCDTMIFYSETYSYKTMVQAAGRIDRLNTPYIDLYYYHLKSFAPLDLAIGRALQTKKKFSEGRYAGAMFKKELKND